jgi:hypothetical protein
MAEFFEVPVRREDGSEGVQYVNIDALSYVERDASAGAAADLKVFLNNGYWFTLSGATADELLNLLRTRLCLQFKRGPGTG